MTKLPEILQHAINTVINQDEVDQLINAREELTARYRETAAKRQFMTTDKQRQAYIIARLPATYAALCAALQAIKKQIPEIPIKSLLDLGAGPGTAMWAVNECFPELENITLIEKDRSLSELGKQLASFCTNEAICSAQWQNGDMAGALALTTHDIVILSYSIGEIDPQRFSSLLDQCWEASKKILLIIEPGTPAGFERIRLIRDALIQKGGYPIAPCPHQLACPMAQGDWCHFSARAERSFLHKRLKGASLGYEDEKFSYVAFSKILYPLPAARLLRHPERHSGHVKLKLCTPEGVKEPVISKKMGTIYKQARKVDWGETIDF